jgi:hypothetical protein
MESSCYQVKNFFESESETKVGGHTCTNPFLLSLACLRDEAMLKIAMNII